MKLSRRQFVAGSVATAAPLPAVAGFAPVFKPPVHPIVISSGNGATFKNGGPKTCLETAYEMIAHGSDVLDALIASVNIVELDPTETSVGYGGIPNADGVVQLDSCCMHGPLRRAGGVGALEGVRTPSRVAQQVMQQTDHHLLVGKGAQDFARNLGFKIEDDLNTDRSRRIWLEWKRRTDPEHYLPPDQREEVGHRALMDMIREGWIDEAHYFGTINCDGINANGDICGVTTTSGLAFKIPGRVGDSPTLGAGLYVDNAIGAAGSTGRGEANLYNLCSFLIIDEMRRGAHPKDAGLTALKRVASNTVEKRLLNEQGHPNFGLQFYILDKQGRHAGVTMSGRAGYAACDDHGISRFDCEALYER